MRSFRVRTTRETTLKAQEKYWDGPDTHPLIANLDARLAGIGFRFVGYLADLGSCAVRWRKPAFAGCEHVISVESTTRERGFVNTKVLLRVVSAPHHAVIKTLALDECDRSTGYAEPQASKPPLIIASVSLNWLAQRWQPQDRDAWQRWWRITRDDGVAAAEHLFGFIETRGMDCFARLGDAPSFAACVLDPVGCFPEHRHDDPGLICVNPFEYAAIALQLSHDRDGALRVIDAYRAQIGKPGPGIHIVTAERSARERCRADRLQAWIRG